MKSSLILAVLLFVTACGQSGDKAKDSPAPDQEVLTTANSELSMNGLFRARFDWTRGPTTDGASTAVLTLAAPDGTKLRDVSALAVRPWMKVHGHGTGRIAPVVEVLSESEGHRYEVSNITFIMSGPWELNINLEVGGVEDTLEWQVEVP